MDVAFSPRLKHLDVLLAKGWPYGGALNAWEQHVLLAPSHCLTILVKTSADRPQR